MVSWGRSGKALVGHDLAVAQCDDAVRVAGDGRIVRDENHGVALLFMDLLKQLHDLAGADGVEVAGRLVGQENAGLVGQAAGNGDTLAFAPR